MYRPRDVRTRSRSPAAAQRSENGSNGGMRSGHFRICRIFQTKGRLSLSIWKPIPSDLHCFRRFGKIEKSPPSEHDSGGLTVESNTIIHSNQYCLLIWAIWATSPARALGTSIRSLHMIPSGPQPHGIERTMISLSQCLQQSLLKPNENDRCSQFFGGSIFDSPRMISRSLGEMPPQSPWLLSPELSRIQYCTVTSFSPGEIPKRANDTSARSEARWDEYLAFSN